MTAICGGGSSGQQVGTAAVVDVGATFIGLLLQLYGGLWLKLLSAFLVLPPLTLAAYCAGDPPAMPVFTSAESDALNKLQFGTADWVSGLAKFGDLVKRLAWYQFCECTSGALVPPPTSIPQPGGSVVFVQPAPLATPCITLKRSGSIVAGAAAFLGPETNIGGLNASLAVLTLTATIPGPVGTVTLTSWFADLSGSTPQSPNVQEPFASTGVTQQIAVQLKPGYLTAQLKVQFAGTTATTATYDATIDLYCNGQAPGGIVQTCCAPDPVVRAEIDSILQLVTLIQRQLAPFGYVPGTVHPALAGTGSFSVSGLIGCKVNVTAIPNSLGRAAGTPVEYFDMGFLTWGTPDGYPQSVRIEHELQLSLPARCGAFTSLAYSLSPGVVMTVTELLREP